MKQSHRWFWLVMAGCLLSGSMTPIGGVQAAPSKESKEVLIDINRADVNELEGVKGIGPLLASRIVKDREANGPFKHLEDLIRVPGIGQAKFEKIKSQITI